MFKTIRFSFKMVHGERLLTMTVKTWPTREKAMNYLIRYANVPWFAGGIIEDEEGSVLYERTPTQSEYFYKTVKESLQEMAQRFHSSFDQDNVGILPFALEAEYSSVGYTV